MIGFAAFSMIMVLALYFFSSMNVYKNLYKKLNEEKSILELEIKKLNDLKLRYENKIKGSIRSLESKQEYLRVAREDLQELRVENTELKHKVRVLEIRCSELYEQINTVV